MYICLSARKDIVIYIWYFRLFQEYENVDKLAWKKNTQKVYTPVINVHIKNSEFRQLQFSLNFMQPQGVLFPKLLLFGQE